MTAAFLLTFFFLMLFKTPIALAIGMSSCLYLVLADVNLFILIQKIYGGANSFPLLAIPLFMMAGILMEKGGIAKRIMTFCDSLVGFLPGGIAIVCVLSSLLFAGISGSAAADVAAVGALLIPAMVKKGFDKDFSTAIVAASGSLGVIIPPSIPMIIYSYLTGVSVSQLFAAGLLPGVLIAVSLILFVIFLSFKNPQMQRTPFCFKKVISEFYKSLWALGAPLVILGGILFGIFTTTESAAIAVLYAFLVGKFIYKDLQWSMLYPALLEGILIASLMMLIISMSAIFSWIVAMESIPVMLSDFLLSVTSDPVLLLLLINLILLLAGMFLETTAALILLVPMIVQMTPLLQINPVQLGVIVVTNLALGMLTPPLGICLMVSCGISGCKIEKVSRKVFPILVILIFDLLLISFLPQMTLWLPKLLF